MKKIVLLLVTLFSLNAVTYASFPVTENQTEQTSTLNEKPPVSGDGPVYGIIALCCGVLGIVMPFLTIPAIVFGAMGLKRSGKGMAIAGLVLGIVFLILHLLFAALWLGLV
jgi:hypothetical protein